MVRLDNPASIDQAGPEFGVARATEHSDVARIEGRSAFRQGDDMVRGQVVARMGQMLGAIAWADPTVLPDVSIDHALR